jgi:hypothetical protein
VSASRSLGDTATVVGCRILGPSGSVNKAHARIRCCGERAVATLKTWKILTKLRCSPSRTTAMVQAILVLHHVEHPTYQG